jgi:hypothetical protein
VFKLLKGFSFGAVQYYKKFYSKVSSDKEQKFLTGSLLEPLSNVCFQRKAGKISKVEYQQLSQELIKACKYKNHQSILKSFALLYAVSPVHPKGLKKVIGLLAGLSN